MYQDIQTNSIIYNNLFYKLLPIIQSYKIIQLYWYLNIYKTLLTIFS